MNWFKIIGQLLGTVVFRSLSAGRSKDGNTIIVTDNKKETVIIDKKKDGGLKISKVPFKKKRK